MNPREMMTAASAWHNAPHEHCSCGLRLVEQEYENTQPVCIDCGYFPSECRCNNSARPCDFCGKETG